MTTLQRLLLVTVLLINCAFKSQAERIMRPKLKELKTWSDNVYVTHTVAYNGNEPHLNLTLTALQALNDVDVHMEFRLMGKVYPNYYFSFNTTMNFCGWVAFKNQSPIGSLIYSYLNEYGKLIRGCPIAKGHYYLLKFWIPEDTSSAMLPEMDFEITFMAYHLDANRRSTLIINDYVVGEAVVQDVYNVKPGIFALFPKGR